MQQGVRQDSRATGGTDERLVLGDWPVGDSGDTAWARVGRTEGAHCFGCDICKAGRMGTWDGKLGTMVQ